MSPTPKPEDSSGNESAEQQLFAESQASASKPRQPPTPAAIRSALLLNAARVDKLRPAPQRPSSLPPRTADMTRKNDGSGKLKRPSFLREDMVQMARANLARRGDIYELNDESPEKSKGVPYKLSETVNHSKPIKRVKNAKKIVAKKEPSTDVQPTPPVQADHTSEDDELFVPSVEADNASTWEGSERLMSPKRNQRKSGRLAGETVAIEHIDFSKQPGTAASKKARTKRKTPEEAPGSDRHSKSPRSESPPIPTKPPVSVVVRPKPQSSRPDAVKFKIRNQDVTLDGEEQVPFASQGDSIQQGGLPDAEPQLPRQRKRPTHSRRKASSNARPAHQSKSNKTTTQPQGRSLGGNVEQEEVALRNPSVHVQAEGMQATAAASDEDAEPSELAWDVNAAEDDERYGSESNLSIDEVAYDGPSRASQVSAFRQVFEFIEGNRQQGKCKSDAAKTIQDVCHAGTVLLRESETTLQDVTRSIEQIRALLSAYGRAENTTQRTKLKADAYEYLFGNLVAFLVPLHGWFSRTYDEVTESLEAVRALYTLAEAIVSFNDAITSWKAPLPARRKNVSFGRDLDAQLIAPLRKFVDSYRIALDDLERAEAVRRLREEAIEEEKQREARSKLRNERWKRWQDLHIWRQECEPDVFRRPRLFIEPAIFNVRYEDPDERDANGVKFERIPLFRERDSPPRRTISNVREVWSDEQMEALIDGLTRFAGPEVFRNIFKKYCRPGGRLRDFTVPEITAQAAYIRSILLSQYQANNWEIPDWIKKIPVLP